MSGGLGVGGGRPQGRVVGQDGLVEVAQFLAGFEAVLVGEQPADPLVSGEGLGLAAAAVQGEHGLAVESLPLGVFGDQAFEFGDELGVPAEPQVEVDAVFQGPEPFLGEPGDGRVPQPVAGDAVQGGSAPVGEGLGERGGGFLQPPLGLGGGGVGDQVAEDGEVEGAGGWGEPVAVGLGAEVGVAGEGAAQPQDVGLDGGAGVAGRVLVPERGGELGDGDGAAGFQEQGGEQGALPWAAQWYWLTCADHFQRTEYAELQGHV